MPEPVDGVQSLSEPFGACCAGEKPERGLKQEDVVVEYLLQRSDVQVDVWITTRRELFSQLRKAASEPTA